MQKNKVIKILATEEMIGQRLDKALSFLEDIRTRSRAENLIEKNLVVVNDKKQKSSYKISKNDVLIISLPQESSNEIVPLDLKLDILFEDQDIIVLNKPAGLVVHPAAGHQDDTLVNALVAHTQDLAMKFGDNRPGIVHRIDKDTSGLLVIAKNDFAHEALVGQFKDRSIHRIYYAIVEKEVKENSGKIESYLARHPTDRKKYASVKIKNKIIRNQSSDVTLGKWSITNFEKINSKNNLSLLRLKLETGRTHQIRVHVSELGHPILGDVIYGGHKKIKDIEVPRFALHAAELGFTHPTKGDRLSFKIDWPEDLKFLYEIFGHKIK